MRSLFLRSFWKPPRFFLWLFPLVILFSVLLLFLFSRQSFHNQHGHSHEVTKNFEEEPSFSLSHHQHQLPRRVLFDPSKDMIALVHLQKTGGTAFNREVIKSSGWWGRKSRASSLVAPNNNNDSDIDDTLNKNNNKTTTNVNRSLACSCRHASGLCTVNFNSTWKRSVSKPRLSAIISSNFSPTESKSFQTHFTDWKSAKAGSFRCLPLLPVDLQDSEIESESRVTVSRDHQLKSGNEFGLYDESFHLEPNSKENLKKLIGDQWLYSRFTVGWPCGKHPSHERLEACFEDLGVSQLVSARGGNIFFATSLREPVVRFLSEFLHTMNGWSRRNDGLDDTLIDLRIGLITSDFTFCNLSLTVDQQMHHDGVESNKRKKELESSSNSNFFIARSAPCSKTDLNSLASLFPRDVALKSKSDDNFPGADSNRNTPERFSRLSFFKFLLCANNPAVNRQTRMMANRRQTKRWSQPRQMELEATSSRESLECATIQDEPELFLRLALENIRALPFFGLAEFPRQSKQLFSWTFGMSLDIGPVADESLDEDHHTKQLLRDLTESYPSLITIIKSLNTLDERLYEEAEKIFAYRLSSCDICDPMTSSDTKKTAFK